MRTPAVRCQDSGFHRRGHPPYVGDSMRAKVEWKVEHDLVFEAPVRLKFYLHQARLFSWWLEPKAQSCG